MATGAAAVDHILQHIGILPRRSTLAKERLHGEPQSHQQQDSANGSQ
ncbi:MAG: hypothetical protein IT165_31165 [Bryobacterales bacterium]|nr:hypothetical protein [Bryobacterales bacterium]